MAPDQRRRPRRARRIGLFALISLVLPAALLAGAVVMAVGKPLVAPGWLHDRLEAELNRQLKGLDVTMGEVSLIVEDNWDPRLRVRNLVLRAPDNTGSVTLARVDARLAFGALLEGQVAPREIRVAGVFMRIIRQGDGTFNISVGDGAGAGAFGQATELTRLGDQVEGYLDLPLLARLDVFRLVDVTLRYEDVRARRGWTVDSGQMRLARNGDDVTISTQMSLLGGRDYVTSIEAFLNTRFGTSETEFGVRFEDMPSGDIASQSAALAWLDILRAPISGSMRGQTDASGGLGPVNVALRVAEGLLQPDDDVQPVPFDGLSSHLTFDPARQVITFADLSLDSKWIKASASGQALLRDLERGLPNTLLGQLELSRFEVNPKELDDVPMVLDRSFADFRLKLDPFELDLGQMVIRLQGNRMQLSGALRTRGPRWDYAIDGRSDGLDVGQVLDIWPDALKPNLRKWIDENIQRITLDDINLAVRSTGGGPPDVYVDFQYRDADLKVLKTMPPVRGASGYASLIRNQFRVAAESGRITADQGGDVDVSGTGFIALDTTQKQSPALARVRLSGTATAAASLLDREPLRVFTKARLPVDLADGRVEAQGNVRFRMKPKLLPEEVRFDAAGHLLDVRTTQFIEGKEIRADSLHVTADNAQVEISGAATVGALPVEGRWHAPLGQKTAGESWIEGTAELSQRAVDEFDIGLPDGSVSGRGTARFEIALARDRPPRLTLSSDLRGVELTAAPLGWRKRAATTGALELTADLTSPPVVDGLRLKADGLTAEGDISLSPEGGLDVMRLSSFAVGEWLQGTGALRGRGPGRAPAVEMYSGWFDMRHMPRSLDRPGAGGDSGPITARLDRVQVTDSLYLTGVQAEMTDQGLGMSGQFAGALKGVAPVSGRLIPHENGTAVEVTSPRGGQLAAAMGVVRAATRGELELSLVPHKTRGVYDGVLKIANIKVQRVPVIAELLNAISVIGLIEQLDGPGILFTEVYSRFRLTPEQMLIGEASAVGPSLGISADGTYTYDGARFDIQGAVSPIYAVNFIGRPISKRGEGLIGFNYTMRGTTERPEFSVNPLSALTPGFFREIFRRRPPDLNN